MERTYTLVLLMNANTVFTCNRTWGGVALSRQRDVGCGEASQTLALAAHIFRIPQPTSERGKAY